MACIPDADIQLIFNSTGRQGTMSLQSLVESIANIVDNEEVVLPPQTSNLQVEGYVISVSGAGSSCTAKATNATKPSSTITNATCKTIGNSLEIVLTLDPPYPNTNYGVTITPLHLGVGSPTYTSPITSLSIGSTTGSKLAIVVDWVITSSGSLTRPSTTSYQFGLGVGTVGNV